MITEAKRSLTDGYRYLVADKKRLLVIYGALKYRGIYRYQPDFDDYVQQAMGWYAEAYCSFPDSPEEDQSSFAHYAYQRIDWHLKDRFRYHKVRIDRQGPSLDGTAFDDESNEWLLHDGSAEMPFERANAQALWRQLWPYLTTKENQFLRCVIELGLSNKEIAEQWGTTPQAVSYTRQRVIKKARTLVNPSRTA